MNTDCKSNVIGLGYTSLGSHWARITNPRHLDITLAGVAQGEKYVIYNSLGQTVLHGELNSASKIDLKIFASGTYFLYVEGTVRKIIKTKWL